MANRSIPGLFALLFICLLALAGCGSPGGSSTGTAAAGATTSAATTSAGGHLRAVTTMSILTDMIEQVGGERVEAQNIIPIGAGPEDYQPTPQDVQKIARADVIFFNGHGLEAWLDPLFGSAKNDKAPKVELSKDLPALDVGGADFQAGNPHFWLDPQYAIKYVEVIRDTLTRLDAGGSSTYAANAAAYIDKLKALDQELEAQAEGIPAAQRKIVTNHDAFPYFAKRYGFTVVGNILGNPEAELSAGDLANLARTIKAEQVKAIFSESQFSPKITETLAREAGVTVVANLYTDSLSDGGAAASYIDMMRYNMRTIVAALDSKAG